ncbi:MAG: hypothetical protein ACKVKS_06305, partial [Candidatus Poseidoniales archaeon]
MNAFRLIKELDSLYGYESTLIASIGLLNEARGFDAQGFTEKPEQTVAPAKALNIKELALSI